MRAGYQVLRGPDPLAGSRVDRADLRQALERELRGKLLRLRQGYAAAAGDEKALGELAAASSAHHPGPAARAADPAQPAGAARSPVALAAEAAGAHRRSTRRCSTPVQRRGERGWRCTATEFEQYMDAVAHAAGYVDQLQLGDQ